MESKYRREKQVLRIKSAQSVGYVWSYDSDYQLKLGRGRHAHVVRGCLSVLFGNVTGHRRSMVVYPDGSVTTKDCPHGTKTTFSRSKLTEALSPRQRQPQDEDEHFMESQQS